jgi:hypothetical protein
MADVTNPSIKSEFSMGNKRVVIASIGTIGTGNDWKVPLKNITSVFITPATNAYAGYAIKANTTDTITFATSATLTDAKVMVIGD